MSLAGDAWLHHWLPHRAHAPTPPAPPQGWYDLVVKCMIKITKNLPATVDHINIQVCGTHPALCIPSAFGLQAPGRRVEWVAVGAAMYTHACVGCGCCSFWIDCGWARLEQGPQAGLWGPCLPSQRQPPPPPCSMHSQYLPFTILPSSPALARPACSLVM